MFRKTLFTLTAVVALGTASTAMAMHGGGGSGGGGGGLGGGHGWGGGAGMHSGGGGWGGGPGLKCHADDACNDYGANDGRAGSGWAGRTAWNRDRFHDHFHNRFRNRNFFAFGFGATTPRITPAGHRFRVTMAGNGFTCAATIPTGTRIRQ